MMVPLDDPTPRQRPRRAHRARPRVHRDRRRRRARRASSWTGRRVACGAGVSCGACRWCAAAAPTCAPATTRSGCPPTAASPSSSPRPSAPLSPSRRAARTPRPRSHNPSRSACTPSTVPGSRPGRRRRARRRRDRLLRPRRAARHRGHRHGRRRRPRAARRGPASRCDGTVAVTATPRSRSCATSLARRRRRHRDLRSSRRRGRALSLARGEDGCCSWAWSRRPGARLSRPRAAGGRRRDHRRPRLRHDLPRRSRCSPLRWPGHRHLAGSPRRRRRSGSSRSPPARQQARSWWTLAWLRSRPGTGRMGAAMARRVAAAGHRVRVWNRTLISRGPWSTRAPTGRPGGHARGRLRVRTSC